MTNINWKKSIFYGSSEAAKDLRAKMQKLASSKKTVLLSGASGVGKSTCAKTIHKLSDSEGPFIACDVASLSDSLAESELFGHTRGAFTNAHSNKKGIFELANGGTLFLDEIGDLSATIQKKLLQVLEESFFYKLGDPEKKIHSHFRLICASHKNLLQLVKEKKFRADLYYRLSTFILNIPELSCRVEDIAYLLQLLLEKEITENNDFINQRVPAALIRHCEKYPPIANMRGLNHLLSQYLLFDELPTIHDVNLENEMKGKISWPEFQKRKISFLDCEFPGYRLALESFEKMLLEEALQKYSQNCQIAKIFKLPTSTTSGILRKNGFYRAKKELKQEVRTQT